MDTQQETSNEEIKDQRAIEREYEEYDTMKPSIDFGFDDFDIMGSYL